MSDDEIKKHYSEMALRIMFEEEDWKQYYADEEAKLEEEILIIMQEQGKSRKEAENIIKSRKK